VQGLHKPAPKNSIRFALWPLQRRPHNCARSGKACEVPMCYLLALAQCIFDSVGLCGNVLKRSAAGSISRHFSLCRKTPGSPAPGLFRGV
jgi:hypothetical protein